VSTSRRIQRYGWVPDLPDHRDHRYEPATEQLHRALPPGVDLRQQCPAEIYDQGQLGSCTANAIAAAFEFDLLKQGLSDFMPSRWFIYYNERAIEGTVDSDSGAMIRDGIKSVAKQGVCSEDVWPYDVDEFTRRPPKRCYSEALHHQVTSYQRVTQSLDQMRSCLSVGHPFVFGFTVYDSFESDEVAQTGVVSMPGPDEAMLGGHAVLAVGYDDSAARFLVRNSWGPDWGDGGYFTMPYDYLTNRGLASDFWALNTVEQ
jgi:C1A family cysteine protease